MADGKLPSQDELIQLFDYDLDAGTLRWKPRPRASFLSDRLCAVWNGANAGKAALNSLAKCGYFRGTLLKKNQYAHRVIWKIAHGTEPELIDHINRNPLDNRISNLRAATRRLNALNRDQGKVAGYWSSRTGKKFYAQLGRQYLGLHDTIEDARAVRDAAYVAAVEKEIQ